GRVAGGGCGARHEGRGRAADGLPVRARSLALASDQPAIETILLEERRYPPPQDFAAQANAQPDIYERDFEEFWESEARERVTWFDAFDRRPEWDPPYAKGYLGGKRKL